MGAHCFDLSHESSRVDQSQVLKVCTETITTWSERKYMRPGRKSVFAQERKCATTPTKRMSETL